MNRRSTLPIPPGFDEEFLLWFRARTEDGWKKVPVFSLDSDPDDEDARWGKWHPDWRGAKWLDPLSDAEIDAIEEQWQIRFPPDYRLLYKWLHATDRPRFPTESGLDAYTPGLFYNWQLAPAGIHWAYEHILEGFVFDAVHNPQCWRLAWGPVPFTEEEARERLIPIVAAAPRLIPLDGHAYLVAEPCQADNPVLSIYQSDIIVIAPDLRTFLLRAWSRSRAFMHNFGPSLLRLTTHDQKTVYEEWDRLMEEKKQAFKDIPFWGDYLFF
jgi:hypothetical protein